MDNYRQEYVLSDIAGGRYKHDAKHGPQLGWTPTTAMTVLMEEVGELAKECLELEAPFDAQVLVRAYDEAIQVGAVAVKIAEWLNRCLELIPQEQAVG